MSEIGYPSFSTLLVDDEAPWLRSLRMTLEGPGGITNIVTCQDSRQVLELLGQQEIGLILLDLTMPHISGEELLTRIMEQYPGDLGDRAFRHESAGDRRSLHEAGRLRLSGQDRR